MADEYTAEEILEIQSEIARLQQEGKPIPERLAKAYSDIASGVKNHTDAIEQSFKRLGSSILTATISSERGAKKYGSVLDAGAGVVGALSKKSKGWGRLASNGALALAGLGKASLAASDTLFKNYQDLSTVGATGSEGIKGLFANLQEFSFSLDEMDSYSNMVKANSDILARVGGTTNKGLKELGKVSEELLAGGSDTEFYEMGMSTEAVNEGLMAYTRHQALLGRSIKLNHDDRTKGTREWIKTQRNLTKITGLNTKALEQIAFAAQNEARFGSYLTELGKRDPEAVTKLTAINQKFTGLYGEDMARGFRDLSVGIVGNSEEASKFQKSFPEAAELILGGVKDEKQITDALQRDAKRTAGLVRGLNLYQSETASMYLDIATYNKIMADKTFDQRQQTSKTELTVTDKGTKNAAEIAAANRKLVLTKDNIVAAGIAPALTAFVALNELLIKIIPGAKPIAAPGEKAIVKPIAGVSGLGSLAAKYESGSRGSQAIGYDSTGGTSYGKYQIATKTGTMDKFMDFLKQDNPKAYERLKNAGPADSGKTGKFAQEWQALASEGVLGDSEHKFIKSTHYDKAITQLTNVPLQQMISNSGALQEVMWSTSVQHGAAGARKIFESVYRPGMSEKDLIKAIYAERATKFTSSTPGVRASVQNRFIDEQSRALEMVTAKPSAATGGVISGPTSGYEATLHGTEAVIPTGKGDSIKIKSSNHIDLIDNNNGKMSEQLTRLIVLSNVIKDQISVSNKILQYTH